MHVSITALIEDVFTSEISTRGMLFMIDEAYIFYPLLMMFIKIDFTSFCSSWPKLPSRNL